MKLAKAIAALAAAVLFVLPCVSTDACAPRGTYWKAEKYVLHFCGEDDPKDVQWEYLPRLASDESRSWWLDLFLNDDGSYRLREVVDNCFTARSTEGTWTMGENGKLEVVPTGYLQQGHRGDVPQGLEIPWLEILEKDSPDGVGKKGMLSLGYHGGSVYFMRAPLPTEQERLQIPDLSGWWALVSNTADAFPEEGKQRDAVGEIYVTESDSGLQTFYAFYSIVSESSIRFGGHVQLWEKPRYAGFGRRDWIAELKPDDAGMAADVVTYLAMLDKDTLELHQYVTEEGRKISRRQIFKRFSVVPGGMNIRFSDDFQEYFRKKR